ncbi:Cytochrome f [Bienertia sinuspersici]
MLSIPCVNHSSMSLSLSSMICKPFPNPQSSSSTSKFLQPINKTGRRTKGFVYKSELNEQSSSSAAAAAAAASESVQKDALKLSIGSPVIITEAPQMIKTAASVPCLRGNGGLVNPGDVGRIVSRKPMDVWAVRLEIGTYLIDRKYFKPLELDE